MNIVMSSFVGRQTRESRFSHFSGSDTELLQLVEANFASGTQGYRAGVWLVPVDPDGFFSSTVTLQSGDRLSGVYEPRQVGEDPRKQVGVVGQGFKKLPAQQVTVVLYHRDVLLEGNENTPFTCPHCDGASEVWAAPPLDTSGACDSCHSFAEWEVISINASPTKDAEPMPVATLLYNHFHVPGSTDGGTATMMKDEEFLLKLQESFMYWKDKAQIVGAT